MFFGRDCEKSLENWVRMDLNRSLLVHRKEPLLCCHISKWDQLVANSVPLQGLQVFGYKAEKRRELYIGTK